MFAKVGSKCCQILTNKLSKIAKDLSKKFSNYVENEWFFVDPL